MTDLISRPDPTTVQRLKSRLDPATAALLSVERLDTPEKTERWDIEHLRKHLQWAVDVEHYTILYYMSAWFSIKDQAAEAARVVKSVVNQEMLHLQSAANLANAFGADVGIRPPLYGGDIPHVDPKLNRLDPRTIFDEFSTEIGPFDQHRLDTMCIIEFPEWFTAADLAGVSNLVDVEPAAAPDEYANIGELYDAIRQNLESFVDDLVPNRNQVDYFGRFYPDAVMTITDGGEAGLGQAKRLIELIVSQGEGKSVEERHARIATHGARRQAGLPSEFQNRADDMQPTFDHFDKFVYLRGQPYPETWPLTGETAAGEDAQVALLERYADLLRFMQSMFAGESVGGFGPTMFHLGAAITACWQQGALPVFSFPASDDD